MDGGFSFQTLSEREGVLLRGILNHGDEERKKSILQYKHWIEQEFLNSDIGNYGVIADHVFRVLQVFFSGRTEKEIIGFVELANVALFFPTLIEDRLLLLTSLLEEVLTREITDGMVLPMIIACQHLFEKYHNSVSSFKEHVIQLSCDRIEMASSSSTIILSLKLLSLLFDICPSTVPNSVVLRLPSLLFPILTGENQSFFASASSLLTSIVLSLKRRLLLDLLKQFRNAVLELFQPFITSLPSIPVDSLIERIQNGRSAGTDTISIDIQSPNSISMARGCLECFRVLSQYGFDCIEDLYVSVTTVTTRCLLFHDSSIILLVLRIFTSLIQHLSKDHFPFVHEVILPTFFSLLSPLSTRQSALVMLSSVYSLMPTTLNESTSSLLLIIHDCFEPENRDVYGLSGVLALTYILSKKQVFEEFLLNELENILPLPFDIVLVNCLLKAILLFPHISEFRDGLYFKFRYCFSPSFLITNNHYRLNLVEDDFSDLALRNEEDVLNCLVLILSLPVSHTGYLSSLLDLIIECVGHKSTRIVMLSLFILIKYYQFALTPKQNDRLYNILFSLIMTTYQDDILLLIAYLLSLLPQYHLLICDNWTYFHTLITGSNPAIIQQLTPLLYKLSLIAPNLINNYVHSVVYQILSNYRDVVYKEDSINSLLLIASFYQDCFSLLENDCEITYFTLLSSLKSSSSLIHRLALFHTITQLCQRKRDFIDETYPQLLAVLSEVVELLNAKRQQEFFLSLNEASPETREKVIREMIKTGTFVDHGIILTFLQTLLQVTDCYSLLISKYPNIIHYILLFSTFEFPQLSDNTQLSDMTLIDSLSHSLIDGIIQNAPYSLSSAVSSIISTLSSFNNNLQQNLTITRGFFSYSENGIRADWYASLSSKYQLSVFNLITLNHIATDLLNEIALFENSALSVNKYFEGVISLRTSYEGYLEDITLMKKLIIRRSSQVNVNDIHTMINKQLCQLCFQSFTKVKAISDEIVLFKEFERLVMKLPIEEAPFVLQFVRDLASALSGKSYHTNLAACIFPFLSTVIHHFSPHLDSTIQFLFPAVIVYWKSNLDSVLTFVTSCNRLLSFPEYYSVIIEQLLFILYDSTYCDNDERITVLFHLITNHHYLQLHLRLVLPAIQYTLQEHGDIMSIQLLGMSLIRNIVSSLDITQHVELITSLLSLLSDTDNELLFMEVLDVICVLASKYSLAYPHTRDITIVFENRYFITTSPSVNHSVRKPVEVICERTSRLSEDDRLLSQSDGEVIPSKDNDSISNKVNQFQLKKEPFLFHSIVSDTPHSFMFGFITTLLDQYSQLCYTRQYHHANLAIVKKAIAEGSIGIHIQFTDKTDKTLETLRAVRITELNSYHKPEITKPSTEVDVEMEQISLQSTLQILTRFVNETPSDNKDWACWIDRFQTLFIQFACNSLVSSFGLYERLIPSLSESIFLCSFMYFWFSLTTEQKSMLFDVFSILSSCSVPNTAGLIFVSMEMAVMELDSQAVASLSERSFPFPFSFIIHWCSVLHFEDSGLRLINYCLGHSVLPPGNLPPILQDLWIMSSRRFPEATPIASVYKRLKQRIPSLVPDVSTAEGLIDSCVLDMGNWIDLTKFFSAKLKETGDPNDKLTLKRGLVKSLFQSGKLSEILAVCDSCDDHELQTYRLCTQLSLCQFHSVYEELDSTPIQFRIENQKNSSLELKKDFYLSMGKVLSFLHNSDNNGALNYIQDIQSMYYVHYTNELKHNKSDILPSQLYLFFLNELHHYLVSTNAPALIPSSFTRLNKIILQNKDNSAIWSDVFVFRKFVSFLYSSAKLPLCPIAISSNLHVGDYIEELKQDVKPCYPVTAGLAYRDYMYVFAKLLYSNNQPSEALSLLKQLRNTTMKEKTLSTTEEIEIEEFRIRCYNRILKWEMIDLNEEILLEKCQEVSCLSKLSVNYKVYLTLNKLYSQYIIQAHDSPSSELLQAYTMIVTNGLILFPGKQLASQLNLLHHLLSLINHGDAPSMNLLASTLYEIPLVSFQQILGSIIDYAAIAPRKWGVSSLQNMMYRRLISLLLTKEQYMSWIVIRLENDRADLVNEIEGSLMVKKQQLIQNILQLKKELICLSQNKLIALLRTCQTNDLVAANSVYVEIMNRPDQCEIDRIISSSLPSTLTEETYHSTVTQLNSIWRGEGQFLSNYSPFMMSLSHTGIDLNLTASTSSLERFEKHVSFLQEPLSLGFTEVLANDERVQLALVSTPSSVYSNQIHRLCLVLSSFMNGSPFSLQTSVLPLTDSLSIVAYTPSVKPLSSVLKEEGNRPSEPQSNDYRSFLWRHSHSSEEWCLFTTSFSSTMILRSFETTYLSMGILSTSDLLLNESTFEVLFMRFSQAFSCLEGPCMLQIDSGARELIGILHIPEKEMLVDSVVNNHSMIYDMIQSEIIECRVEDEVSTSILSSLTQRIDEIRQDSWNGLAYL